MMYKTSIDDIFNMLDWNQSEETQAEGRKLANKIQNINIFIQPIYEKVGKNVWDNCAIIIKEKTDEEIYPFLERLCYWIADLNWPGSNIIFNRLENFKDKNYMEEITYRCIIKASIHKDYTWLTNILDLQSSIW